MENSRAHNNKIEMKNINKDIVGWLEDVIEENNGRIEKQSRDMLIKTCKFGLHFTG